MADYGIQIGKVFFVGLLSLILMIDTVVGLQALYYWQLNQVETAENLYEPPTKLKAMLAAEQTRLTDYRTVDAKKGIVAIPIGRAMALIVAEVSPRGSTTATPTGEAR